MSKGISEKHIIHTIKNKLQSNNAIITKADKGNTIVIEYKQEYCRKIGEFIDKNNILKVYNDPTKIFQKQVKTTLNDCQAVLHKDEKWKFINMNPTALTIKVLIKIHKENAPIRPIINWRNASVYKVTKMLTKKLQIHIPLPYTFNVKNSVHLIEELSNITYSSNLQLASFYITNMYSNVPTDELLHIFDLLCEQSIGENMKKDLRSLIKMVLEQNYFQFDNDFYSQEIGLAMGSPASSILSEMYHQYKECTEGFDILQRNNIPGYFHYVDDILIIYDRTLTNIGVLNSFNSIMPTMMFTMEKERNNTINFLDIAVTKESDKFKYDIYRKNTTTDSIIPSDSCHPVEHKMATVRYLKNRMNGYHLNAENKRKGRETIKHIPQANKYDASILDTPPKTRNKKGNEGKIWARFTYTSKETKSIAKLFKNSIV
jgi:hypothetical protein